MTLEEFTDAIKDLEVEKVNKLLSFDTENAASKADIPDMTDYVKTENLPEVPDVSKFVTMDAVKTEITKNSLHTPTNENEKPLTLNDLEF